MSSVRDGYGPAEVVQAISSAALTASRLDAAERALRLCSTLLPDDSALSQVVHLLGPAMRDVTSHLAHLWGPGARAALSAILKSDNHTHARPLVSSFIVTLGSLERQHLRLESASSSTTALASDLGRKRALSTSSSSGPAE